MTNIQMNDVGVKVTINVVDENGDAITLTGATNLKIKIGAENGEGITKTATLEGTTALSCLTEAGDINVAGVWKAQAYYELGGFRGHTKPVEVFTALPNLD